MNKLTNVAPVTFGELLPLVGESGKGKLPKAAQIRNDENEEIFLESRNGENEITVYKSGKVIYGKGKYVTVTAVDRCANLTYYLHPSTEEQDDKNDDRGVAGCECHLKSLNGVMYLTSTVPLECLVDLPWEMVIGFTCEPRLAHNQEERESSHDEFSFNNDGNDWDPNQWVASAEDEYLEQAEPDMSEHDKMLHFLRTDAKKTLTDKQSMAIDLHYNKEKNQDDVAKEMDISQPMVHKHLKAAYRNMEKAYYKNK